MVIVIDSPENVGIPYGTNKYQIQNYTKNNPENVGIQRTRLRNLGFFISTLFIYKPVFWVKSSIYAKK